MNNIQNIGKCFEQDIVNSLPSSCWHKRLNDNAASWGNGNNTRFASTNECDFLLFDCRLKTLHALELKSTKGSLSFWRKDFEDGKKHSWNIKKNQIQGLLKWSQYPINCGFLFNFRQESNRTFFVSIGNFLNYTSKLNKKSINFGDVLNMNPVEIDNKIIRTHYKYNIEKFLNETNV